MLSALARRTARQIEKASSLALPDCSRISRRPCTACWHWSRARRTSRPGWDPRRRAAQCWCPSTCPPRSKIWRRERACPKPAHPWTWRRAAKLMLFRLATRVRADQESVIVVPWRLCSCCPAPVARRCCTTYSSDNASEVSEAGTAHIKLRRSNSSYIFHCLVTASNLVVG